MEDLIVSKRVETLLYRIYPALKNFPKSEKFGLCENIKQEFFNILKYIQLANSVKSKRVQYLQEADGHCRILQILIKLSKEQEYISIGFFRDIDLEVSTICNMISNWIKKSSNK